MQSQSASSHSFSALYQNLTANLASSSGQLEIAKARSGEYRRLYEHVGPERFAAGCSQAIHRHATGFFPTIPEFEPFIPAYAGPARETCPLCCKTGGLVYGFYRHEASGKMVGGMTKCLHGQEVERFEDYQERRVGQ